MWGTSEEDITSYWTEQYAFRSCLKSQSCNYFDSYFEILEPPHQHNNNPDSSESQPEASLYLPKVRVTQGKTRKQYNVVVQKHRTRYCNIFCVYFYPSWIATVLPSSIFLILKAPRFDSWFSATLSCIVKLYLSVFLVGAPTSLCHFFCPPVSPSVCPSVHPSRTISRKLYVMWS